MRRVDGDLIFEVYRNSNYYSFKSLKYIQLSVYSKMCYAFCKIK